MMRRAFTLIELIVYVGITAMVVVALTNVMLTILETRQRISGTSEREYAARFVMERVMERALRSDGVDAQASVLERSDGRLVLRMPVAKEHPTVIAVSGSRLTFTQGIEPPSYLTAPQVQVDDFSISLRQDTGSWPLLSVRLTVHEASQDASPGTPLTVESSLRLRP